MQSELLYILENHLSATLEPTLRSGIGSYIRRIARDALVQNATIDTERYKVWGSSGNGNWAEIPWISIADRDITTTAQKGYYIVYLFKSDMSGVYLSLNQGWTFYEETYKAKEGRDRIKVVSQSWQKHLSSFSEDFSSLPINLNSKGSLGKGYELGHICGKYYSKNEMPNDLTLINDLRNLMGVYKELKGYLGSSPVNEITKYLAEQNSISWLTSEEESDRGYQRQIKDISPSHTPRKPHQKPQLIMRGEKQCWVRDPAKAKESLFNVQYKCEFDLTHDTFEAHTTQQNFVEAHHLIPMKLQDKFSFSLDVPGNIVSLCPNCHRAIHHAVTTTREKIFSKLYMSRKNSLEDFGIPISESDLLKVYAR